MAKAFPNTGVTIIDSSSDLPAASAALEGVMMFQKDSNELKICDGASWISVLDTDNRPMSAWTAWNPTITQSNTVTKNITNANYIQLGKLVIAQARLEVTSSGTAGNKVLVSLPTPTISSITLFVPCGTGYVYDASGGATYPCNVAVSGSATVIEFIYTAQNVPNAWGANPNIALANGDAIAFIVVYEAA